MCRVINNYIIVLQEINSCYGYFKKISGFSITTTSYQESALHGKFAPLQTSITKNVIG